MIILILFAAGVVWFGCGLLTACLIYAHFQKAFPRLADKDRFHDVLMAVGPSILGPLALVVAFLFLCNHGWFKYGLLFPGRRP